MPAGYAARGPARPGIRPCGDRPRQLFVKPGVVIGYCGHADQLPENGLVVLSEAARRLAAEHDMTQNSASVTDQGACSEPSGIPGRASKVTSE